MHPLGTGQEGSLLLVTNHEVQLLAAPTSSTSQYVVHCMCLPIPYTLGRGVACGGEVHFGVPEGLTVRERLC